MTDSASETGWDALSDDELVRTYRDHDVDDAFATLVRRYQVRLFRVLVGYLGETSLAEELCQRAMIKAAMKIDQLREGQAFYAWLLKVARATAIDEVRSNERRRKRETEPAPIAEADDPAERYLVKDAVRSVLAKMAPDDRLVLVLADLHKHSMGELAEVLECKESAAKMRVKRARERFRKLYAELS